MISYIKLKNFKSFKNITLDLRGKKGIPQKLAFIYGENGSGKTNLMDSMFFLRNSFDTLQSIENLKNFESKNLKEIISENNQVSSDEILKKILKQTFRTLEELIAENKMIDSEENMEIEVGFYLNNKEGYYSATFNESGIIKESLYYTINERIGEMFLLSTDEIRLSDSVFIDKKYKNDLLENVNKYWGKHSFMSILFYEKRHKNKKYINEKINNNLLDAMRVFNRCTIICKGSTFQKGFFSIPYKFLGDLEFGTINNKNKNEIPIFENFLNSFFTQLYSDIKEVFYKKTITENNNEKYELYVKKTVYNKIIEIPFNKESTGTQKLLEIIPALISSLLGESVLIDEVDSGIHDLLMVKIIELFKDSLLETNCGQFIATTHNTLLMKHLSPENIYIINSDAKGNKKIVNLKEYYFRTQKNNNTQLKYLNGDYEGIPNVGYLDFNEIVSELCQSIEKERKPNDKE